MTLRLRPTLSLAAITLAACSSMPSAADEGEASASSSSSSSSTEGGSEDGSTTMITTAESAEETASSTESETSPSSTDPTAFVPNSEDGWWLEQCDPFIQDCPEGEKCVAYASTGGSWDANKCVPITGDHTPGESCVYAGNVEAYDDCEGESACWNIVVLNGELVGTCFPFCEGTADAPLCPMGSSCFIGGEGSVNLCLPSCNPLVDACPPGEGCSWTGADFHCVITPQSTQAGEVCTEDDGCAPGQACVVGELVPSCDGPSCCTLFCDLSLLDGQCADLPGTSCVAFFEQGEAPEGLEDVGVCLL